MDTTENTLVVLIDADDVKHAFPTWPDHICLAACLRRDGVCSMVVFHRDERHAIPVRLVRSLQLDVQDVCFVPQVHGYPTKNFLYSDERRLMALVASDPANLEAAIDYAVNYTYALEEGLDPSVLLGLETSETPIEPKAKKAVEDSVAQEQVAVRELSPLLPDFLRKSAERARRPRFASVRKSKPNALVSQV